MAEPKTPKTAAKPLSIPTDFDSPAPQFNPAVGEEAFVAKEASLRAMTPEEVLVPNCASPWTAVVALRLVEVIRAPERMALFAKLPDTFMQGCSADELEKFAWTLWFVDTRFQSYSATSKDVRVDLSIADQATKVRTRMLRVLDYHFGDHSLMQAEIADIRAGQGYQDLASDLTRLAGHYEAHADKLSNDKVLYQPTDNTLARSLANQIVTSLRHPDKISELADLRNRAWTKVVSIYAALKAAGDFIYRNEPRELALFPGLRSAVLALTSRSRAAADTPEEPVPPAVAPATPSPTTPTTPVAPGMPGGSPLLR